MNQAHEIKFIEAPLDDRYQIRSTEDATPGKHIWWLFDTQEKKFSSNRSTYDQLIADFFNDKLHFFA